MPRSPRLVVPGLAHHIIQRGNRRQALFFGDADRRAYLKLIAEACARHATICLAWCLMDNHVHLILVPAHADGLRAPLASAHTAYSQRVNRIQALSGHLFQGRFASYAMDDAHLMVAARYVENNPVAAGLVAHAGDWPWSSARAHLGQSEDGLTEVAVLARHVPNWRAMLARGLEASDEQVRVEQALRSGRPLGAVPGAPAEPPRRGRPPNKQK